MNTQITPPPKKNSVLGFIRFVVRFLFVLILAIGLGVGIYYLAVSGIPWLYQRYVQPVEDNTLRLDDLEARQDQEMELLTSRLDSMQQRLTDLEIQSDAFKERIRDLELQLTTARELQDAQAESIAKLAALPAIFEETQADLEALQGALAELAISTGNLEQQITSLSEAEQEPSSGLVKLKNEIQLLQCMQVLTRARLFLSQGNLESAETNIKDGLEVLTILRGQMPDNQKPALEQVNEYLGEALQALPDSPVQAADQLDGAWSLLVQSLFEEPGDSSTTDN